MPKRNTETLFLRVAPEVARLVRRASEERKNLLSAVEEALLNRIDERVGSALRRVGDLYAKEAFDHAEGLFLIKALLSLEVRDERQLEHYLVNARRDATERLRHRAGPVAEALAGARKEIEQVRAERDEARTAALALQQKVERADAEAQKQIDELIGRVQALQGRVAELQSMSEYERARDEWAAAQYENQGLIRRKSFNEWRDEYTRTHRPHRMVVS